MGKKFADANNPLLFSVRSGARVSMPGMLDTVLNLGLNDETVKALAKASGSERFAYDSYRRFLQMFSDVVMEIPKKTIDVIIDEVCKYYSIENDVLRGQGRTKDTALARQIAMFLIRELTNMSLKEIGREFDNRDHTTVLHSTDRIEKLKKSNPDIAEVIKDINANINARYE